MSKPRTPDHFPRMKVRGGRRRRDAAITQAWRGFQSIDWKSIGKAFDGMAGALTEVGKAVVRMRLALQVSWYRAIAQQHESWVATHQLPATPSPYAAPIRKA